MADMRGLTPVFEASELTVYGNSERPGTIEICVNGEWQTLTAEQAVQLSVAMNNHSYPATRPRR